MWNKNNEDFPRLPDQKNGHSSKPRFACKETDNTAVNNRTSLDQNVLDNNIMYFAVQAFRAMRARPGAVLKFLAVLLIYLLPGLMADVILVILLYQAAGLLLMQMLILLVSFLFNVYLGSIVVGGSISLSTEIFCSKGHPSFLNMISIFFHAPAALKSAWKTYFIHLCIPACLMVIGICAASYMFNWRMLHWGFIGISGLIPNVLYTLLSIFNGARNASFAPFVVLVSFMIGTCLLLLLLSVLCHGMIQTAFAMDHQVCRKKTGIAALFLAMIPALTTFIYLCFSVGAFLVATTLFNSGLMLLLVVGFESVLFCMWVLSLAGCWVFASVWIALYVQKNSGNHRRIPEIPVGA